MLPIKVAHKGVTDKGLPLNVGDVVGYRGHLPGGNIAIEFQDGTKDIAHPFCFKEFR